MPLEDLLLSFFKVKTRAIENPNLTSIGTTGVLVLPNNPNRLAWILVNLHSTQIIYLALTNEVSTTRGVRVAAAGGKASMVWNEDFQTVGREIWGIASGATTSCYVIEVVEIKG